MPEPVSPHLAGRLDMDIIIVGDAGLGTIHHTISTVMAAKSLNINIKGIILNRYDSNNICHVDNKKILESISNIPILGTIPEINGVNVEKLSFGNLKYVFDECFDINKIIEIMN